MTPENELLDAKTIESLNKQLAAAQARVAELEREVVTARVNTEIQRDQKNEYRDLIATLREAVDGLFVAIENGECGYVLNTAIERLKEARGT
jgi:DNA-binding FrmR family transcriptional regulator